MRGFEPHAPRKSDRAQQRELLALGIVSVRHDLARRPSRGKAVPEVGAGFLTRIVVLAGLDARGLRDRAGMDLRDREDVALGKAPIPEGNLLADDAVVPRHAGAPRTGNSGGCLYPIGVLSVNGASFSATGDRSRTGISCHEPTLMAAMREYSTLAPYPISGQCRQLGSRRRH